MRAYLKNNFGRMLAQQEWSPEFKSINDRKPKNNFKNYRVISFMW
jgi:hypothetical protein